MRNLYITYICMLLLVIVPSFHLGVGVDHPAGCSNDSKCAFFTLSCIVVNLYLNL